MRFANLVLADITEAMNRGCTEPGARRAMLLSREPAGVHIQWDPARLKAALDQDPLAARLIATRGTP